MPALSFLSRLAADRRGGISIIGALSLTGIVGMAGIAMETSHGYAVKVDNQRIADAAALAAAIAYSADITNTAVVLPTAQGIAQANGIAASAVSAPTPTTDANNRKIITVTITTAEPLSLTRVITSKLSYNVKAVGVAAVVPGSSSTTTTTPANSNACFLALDTTASNTYGIVVSGAAKIEGTQGTSGCDVQAVRGISVTGSAYILARNIQGNGNVVIDGSAYLRAVEVDAGGTLTKPSWNSTAIVTAPTANNWFSGKTTAISDPLAAGTVQTALAKVTVTSNYPIPPAPVGLASPTTTSNTSTWDYTATTKTSGAPGTLSGSVWTIPKGTYNAANIRITGGSSTLRFSPGSTVIVSGTLSASGSTAIEIQSDATCPTANTNCNSFDAGTFTVEGGGGTNTLGHGVYRFGTATFNRPTNIGTATVQVTNATVFGPYTHTLGAGAHSFGKVTVSGSGNVTMGDGTFWSTQEVSVGGSAKLVLGAGTKTIGANSSGQSILIDGSTLTSFGTGDITITGSTEIGGSTTVQFGAGNVWMGSRNANSNTRCATTTYDAVCRSIYLSGSSNLSFGNGTFRLTGGIETGGSSSLTIGSTANHWIRGNLLLNGAVTFGSGAYTVYGYFTKTASLGATGSNLSFFLSGPIDLSGSASSTFSAPSTAPGSTSDALQDILFASLTTSNSQYTGSSQNTYSGTIYVPNSNFTISGSGSIKSGSCFALIAKTISVTGSGAGASKCAGIAAAGSTSTSTQTAATVALVQ